MANIKNLDTSLICLNEVSFVNDKAAINYEIEYCEDGNDAYPLYLVFKVDGYFLCADNEMKYLTFAPTEKNTEMLENYKKLWDEVKEEIRTIQGDSESFEYENDYMICRFESEYGLPMGKTVNIPLCVIIARPVFEDSGKFYSQVFLERCYLKYHKGESANGSYYGCKTPLSINNSEYGRYLLKKRVVNFVTTDSNSL